MQSKMSSNAVAILPQSSMGQLNWIERTRLYHLQSANHIFAKTFCRLYAQQSMLAHSDLSKLFDNRNAFSTDAWYKLIIIYSNFLLLNVFLIEK